MSKSHLTYRGFDLLLLPVGRSYNQDDLTTSRSSHEPAHYLKASEMDYDQNPGFEGIKACPRQVSSFQYTFRISTAFRCCAGQQ